MFPSLTHMVQGIFIYIEEFVTIQQYNSDIPIQMDILLAHH